MGGRDPNLNICCGPSTWSTFTSHFTLNLRAHQLQPWISISHGPLEFHGHGAWYIYV